MSRLKINVLPVLLIKFILINTTYAQLKTSFSPNIINWEKSRKKFNRRNLYDHINGGATIYLDRSFKKLYVAEYVNKVNESIHVEIYKFSLKQDAKTLFEKEYSPEAEIIDIGDKGYSTGFSGINFIKEEFYVKIYSYSQSYDIKKTVSQIAIELVKNFKD